MLALAVTVIVSIGLCFLPFAIAGYREPPAGLSSAQGALRAVAQVLHRVFPFDRGIYEDKVANLWCTLSLIPHPLFKWTRSLPKDTMLRLRWGTRVVAVSPLTPPLSLVTTLVSLVPSSLSQLLWPTRRRFLYGLICGSFSFYLFSFQVHEKTVLLPLLPLSLLSMEAPLTRVVMHMGVVASARSVSCLLAWILVRRDRRMSDAACTRCC